MMRGETKGNECNFNTGYSTSGYEGISPLCISDSLMTDEHEFGFVLFRKDAIGEI